jgi:urease accessory protein
MSAEYLGLLLADGRLPVGAHTQSAGVEPAMQGGLALDQLPDYLAVRLRTVTEVEAATAVVARRIWTGPCAQPVRGPRAEPVEVPGGCPSTSSGHVSGPCAQPVRGPRAEPVEALVEVDQAWRARTVSDAMRDASDLLGRGYLRLGLRLWNLEALRGRTWCRPVVVGVLAAEAGLSTEQTARLIGFEDVQSAIAAALKLQPFDPVLGVIWARAAGVQVEAMVGRVAGIDTTEQIPAYAAPQLEHWAQLHKHSERRLFRA